ncbi:DinB family protein [Halostreptopolyspora alba]|uniref:DinB family protein n=1 Tax=Halostreptopolyspora alba TaxID=2487137 RepID=A0A3N0EBI1_9ACTN|nr:DinB family protein [Nocardiopsaceae bacterium YIM 96095]
MSDSRVSLLRWQFDLVWSLFEYHLVSLEPADFLWEPTPYCWTLRWDADEGWVPDWADSEPAPVPVPTIAWLTWHIGWWWTTTIDRAQQRAPEERGDLVWPGAGQATVTWLRGLSEEWLELLGRLTDADLDTTAPFPWRDDPTMTMAHMVGWVNSELMKNTAEIGQLRMLRAVSPPSS